jgi:flagellar motor switch protein FliN/FliY
MGDSALSQAEIDALLAGVDSSSPGGGGGGNGEAESKTLQGYLSGTVDAQSSNLSTMTGATVTLKGPEVAGSNREALVEKLPDMVTAVKADFNAGFPGEHLFLFPEDAAKAIAALMNKEENIELDAMAMSVIGEMVGTMVGTQITTLTGKTGNKSIANVAPEAVNIPKATAALPSGEFQVAEYRLDLGDGVSHQVWEVYGPAAASEIAKALTPAQASKPAQAAPAANAGGFGGPSNLQSVKYPNLTPHPTAQEAGNIGLIMDVYMEMTVELGRTKKLIKEILGMGEGTIIELDKLAGEPVDILVNQKLIAKGEVVVIDENFGVRVTEIVAPMERMTDLS